MRQSRKQNRMQHGAPLKRVLFSVLALVAAAGAGVVLAFVVPSQTTSKTSAPDTAEVKSAKTKAKTSSRTASSAVSSKNRFVGVTQTGLNRAKSKAFIEDSGLDDTGLTKVEFPDEVQGTWYGYNKYYYTTSELEFSYNRLITWDAGEIGVSYGYDGQKRTAADQQVFENPGATDATSEARQKSWMAVMVVPIWHGMKNLVNIRGWYQSAGDGTYYYVSRQTINGQQVEVLTQAAGAGVWTDTHLFRSTALARKYADTHFDSDIDRLTD